MIYSTYGIASVRFRLKKIQYNQRIDIVVIITNHCNHMFLTFSSQLFATAFVGGLLFQRHRQKYDLSQLNEKMPKRKKTISEKMLENLNHKNCYWNKTK